MIVKYIYLALFAIVLVSIGQFLLKLGANNLDFSGMTIKYYIESIIFNRYLIIAMIVYIFANFFWIYILSKIELSFAYIITSLSFPIVFLLSYIFLDEHITYNKILSILLIIIANIILFMENGK